MTAKSNNYDAFAYRYSVSNLLLRISMSQFVWRVYIKGRLISSWCCYKLRLKQSCKIGANRRELTSRCDNHGRRGTKLVVGMRRRHRTVTSRLVAVLVPLHPGLVLCRRVAATWRRRLPVAIGTLSEVGGEAENVCDRVRSRHLVRFHVYVRVPCALGRVERHGRSDGASESRKGTGVLHYRRDNSLTLQLAHCTRGGGCAPALEV